MSLTTAINRWRSRCDATLSQWLEATDSDPRLLDAMRYSTLNGGKRLRPVLVYAACSALGGDDERADGAATAVECIHAYSLIHDDLPAMDNDDLRRGQPTCHKAFDDATAILAGDALQALAFEILASDRNQSADARIEMLRILAQASGARGMVGGQAVDIAAEAQQQSLEQLQRMHSLKTGALISASVALGGLSSGHADQDALEALQQYAAAIGLAFQIQDDILDIESSTAELGKTQGADLARGKSTYPALLGLDGAKQQAAALHHQAVAALAPLGERADYLRQLADYIIQRTY
ncbi:(2E,6E)-farnesyl diphosphate synthase [Motiliproteus sediminis]|uniref:(2E,6E)-farnesyl diphosphate synthase n=1 Tax=Motiliproteus sediminis TaxID=1468178 RepID=UPI001AF0050E|nr:farnesyl diphosphate synthase [Motiliproteus sediminis]